jgi:hypothetical protein
MGADHNGALRRLGATLRADFNLTLLALTRIRPAHGVVVAGGAF